MKPIRFLRPSAFFYQVISPITLTALGLFWLTISALSSQIAIDEARWTYVAREWFLYHTPPYKGVIENKLPLIFYIMGFGEFLYGHQIWFARTLGIGAIVGASWLLYRIGEKWAGEWGGVLAMMVYLFANAWRSYDGPWTAQTETFMNFFSICAFYYVATTPREGLNRPRRLLIPGILMGLAIGFKQIALVDTLALGFFMVLEQAASTPSSKMQSLYRTLLGLGAGIILTTVVTAIPVWASGVSWKDYIQGAWLLLFNQGNFGYLTGSSASWAVRLQNFPETLTRLDTIVFASTAVYLWIKRSVFEKRQIPARVLVVWMCCDFLGVQTSGYYFPHQFKQLLPSLSLGIGLIIQEIFNDLAIRTEPMKITLRICTTGFLTLAMICSPEMPPLSRAWQKVFHPVPTNEQSLGLWLKSQTLPTEFIYVVERFSDVVQYYSERRSSSRYYNVYYIEPPAIPEVAADLTTHRPPRFIILWDNKAPEWLWQVMANSFTYRFSNARYWVYENSKHV